MLMVNDNEVNLIPKEMTDGGEHVNDCNRRKVPSSNMFRDRLLKIIIDKDSHRPSRK